MDLESLSYHLQMVQNLAALYQAVWVCLFNRVQKVGSLVSRLLGFADMIDRKKLPLPKRITMTTLVAVCRMAGAHVGVSTILERSALLIVFGVANALETHPFPGRLAVWCSDNALVSINAVALHRARLVLGWVTAFGQVNCPIT